MMSVLVLPLPHARRARRELSQVKSGRDSVQAFAERVPRFENAPIGP